MRLIVSHDETGVNGIVAALHPNIGDLEAESILPYKVGWFGGRSLKRKTKTEEVTNVKAADTERNVLEGQSAPDDGGIKTIRSC